MKALTLPWRHASQRAGEGGIPAASVDGSLWFWGALICFAFTGWAEDLKLITLDPGHFHAALFQREMLPGVSPTAYVYAPLGPDLTAPPDAISASFNSR